MVVLVNMYYWKRVCTSVIVNVNVFVSITYGTFDEEVGKGVGGLIEVVAGNSLDGCTFLFGNEKVTLSEGEICVVSPMSGHSLPLEPGCFAVSVIVRLYLINSIYWNFIKH